MILKLQLTLIFTLLLSIVGFSAVNESKAACPTIVVTGTNVNCYGGSNGSAQVAISNGSGNYTITWSNGGNVSMINGLPVGTYTVSVKDNVSGCSVVGAYVVGSPDPIQVTETITNVNCNGLATGSITITVVGGNGGNFAPSLFVGSYLGFFVAKTVNLLNFTHHLPIANFTIVGMAGIISGFFFGFTRNFYEKFRYPDGDLFAEFEKFDKAYIHKYAGDCGKWGGQEMEILRFKENGGKVFVIGECWIDHIKKRDWNKARQLAGEYGWHLKEKF